MSTGEYFPTSNAIADKIIRGENVDVAAALAEEKKARARREQDAVRLQLLVARMAKALGRNVELRTLLAALAVMGAQGICHTHPTRHGQLYVDFLQALKAAIEGTYPPGVKLQPPDMSVLDTQTPDVRVVREHAGSKEEPYAGESPPHPLIEVMAEARDILDAQPVPTEDRRIAPPLSPHAIAEAFARAEQAEDDLKIPAFLKKDTTVASKG